MERRCASDEGGKGVIRREITPAQAAGRILEALPKGILLTTKAGEKVNTMVIGWGAVGVNWGQHVFAAYVRHSRFTHDLLEQNREFTVNIPLSDPDPKLIALCGARSGRDLDKLTEGNLTPVESRTVSAPALMEFPMTLECKVIYQQTENLDLLPPQLQDRYYPQGDPHDLYYGLITAAYVLEEDQ